MRGSLSERDLARVPALGGHSQTLWRSAGALRLGDALRHGDGLHLHRGRGERMGTGEKQLK